MKTEMKRLSNHSANYFDAIQLNHLIGWAWAHSKLIYNKLFNKFSANNCSFTFSKQ